MRKIIISAFVAAAAFGAVPAAAQHQGYGHSGWNQPDRHGPSRQAVAQLRQDLDRAEHQIRRAADRRQISRRDATILQRQAAQVRRDLQRASRNGLSGREFAQLRQQVNRLQRDVRFAERNSRRGRG